MNGQEKDDELAGTYSAEYWQYDARLGRRWNVDPVDYPWQSSYTPFNNNPIYFEDSDGDEARPPKIKLMWQIKRIFNPNWWGKKGLDNHRCKPGVYKTQSPKRFYTKIKVVDKTEVRLRSERIRVRERNGQSSDQVVNTPNGGAIKIEKFDDYIQVDQLLIEDAAGGNGVGTDPNNTNTNNDLFASPTGPDNPATSPPIRDLEVPVVSSRTRIRVRPNVNGSTQTTIYDARLKYQYKEKRTKHREYLYGVIPMIWKNNKSEWKSTSLDTKPEKKTKTITK
jgi:hypothetical protein